MHNIVIQGEDKSVTLTTTTTKCSAADRLQIIYLHDDRLSYIYIYIESITSYSFTNFDVCVVGVHV